MNTVTLAAQVVTALVGVFALFGVNVTPATQEALSQVLGGLLVVAAMLPSLIGQLLKLWQGKEDETPTDPPVV